MTAPLDNDTELRAKLLSLYSANFNDGEPIEERIGSRDMVNVSVIVEFIDDYVLALIKASNEKTAREARIDELKHLDEHSNWYGEGRPPISVYGRISELQSDTPNKGAKELQGKTWDEVKPQILEDPEIRAAYESEELSNG